MTPTLTEISLEYTCSLQTHPSVVNLSCGAEFGWVKKYLHNNCAYSCVCVRVFVSESAC